LYFPLSVSPDHHKVDLVANLFRKYFADSNNYCTFIPSVPAKPLNNAQISGAFFMWKDLGIKIEREFSG